MDGPRAAGKKPFASGPVAALQVPAPLKGHGRCRVLDLEVNISRDFLPGQCVAVRPSQQETGTEAGAPSADHHGIRRDRRRRSIAGVKLLLTSGGIRNESMRDVLAQLVGTPFAEARVVLVMTAATAQAGDQDWLVEDINRVHGLGWGQFNILEINGLPRELVLRRMSDADVIYVEGGNAYHLAHSIVTACLADELLHLLEDKVYVGASAGSMQFTRRLTHRLTALFGADDELYQLNERTPVSPFDLFDWFVQPHVDFASWDPFPATRLDCPLYAIDDQTALRIVDNHVEVVSEGKWKLVNRGSIGAPAAATNQQIAEGGARGRHG